MTKWKDFAAEQIEQKGPNVLLYRLTGLLTNTKDSYAFVEEVRERIHTSPAHLILNLGAVEHITSAGVGILASCYASVTNAGRRLYLVAVPARSEALLRVVGIANLIEQCSTEEEAVAKATL